jgi:hypothetical protein
LVATAYSDLFDLYREEAWDLDTDLLIAFFRSADKTTAIVGRLQSTTFQTLARFSGHGEMPAQKAGPAKGAIRASRHADTEQHRAATHSSKLSPARTGDKKADVRRLGLTVRIEINLPADGDQGTYDRIFKSLRENFLNE